MANYEKNGCFQTIQILAVTAILTAITIWIFFKLFR